MTTTDIPRHYIDAVNMQDIAAMESILANDVLMNHPMGTFKGKAEVLEFYALTVFKAKTVLSARGPALVASDRVCVEILGVFPPDNGFGVAIPDQYAIDLFQFNQAGKVVAIDIYYRSFPNGGQ